jgi:hypothetical protein
VSKWHYSRLQSISVSLLLLDLSAKVERGSAVDIATAYGLDERDVGVPSPDGVRMFSSPYRPDRLWAPPSLLSNGYRGLFPGGKAAGA